MRDVGGQCRRIWREPKKPKGIIEIAFKHTPLGKDSANRGEIIAVQRQYHSRKVFGHGQDT